MYPRQKKRNTEIKDLWPTVRMKKSRRAPPNWSCHEKKEEDEEDKAKSSGGDL